MKIALVGDVMLGRLVNKMLKHSHSSYPWGNTIPLLKTADIRICNLECVLSDIGKPWSTPPKVFHFRSDEKNIQTLLDAKINIVSIANNHVLDFEYEALERMVDLLDQYKVLHAGAGKNLAEASQPAIFQLNNQKIAFLAFTDNELYWEAEENKPGIFYLPTELSNRKTEDFLINVEHWRNKTDFLIVSAHWGSNWGYDPPHQHISMAHSLIDAGADLIFGHSPHVFRGIEIYKNRPIIYSAGDFIDDYAVDEIERNDESFIFMIEKTNSYIKVLLYPISLENFQTNLAFPLRQKQILSRMEKLCKELRCDLKQFSDHASIEITL